MFADGLVMKLLVTVPFSDPNRSLVGVDMFRMTLSQSK